MDYKYQLNREFPLVNETYEDIYKINLGDHLTKNFTDNTGRIVAVFDGVVPKEELDLLRSYFMKSNSAYLYDGYDGDFTESSDNVNWIVKKFVSIFSVFRSNLNNTECRVGIVARTCDTVLKVSTPISRCSLSLCLPCSKWKVEV